MYEIMTKGVKILPLDLKNGDWYHFRGQLTTVELTYNLQSKLKKLLTFLPIHRLLMNAVVKAQVAQARNMSIGEHRHCCVTFKI